MRIYRNVCNILKDSGLDQPIFVCCIFFLLTILSSPVHAQTVPLSAKILMEKGDSCRLEWKYNKALGYYQQAYNVSAVAKDEDVQIQLLERIMRTHDVLRHWKEMPESSYRLYMLAKERGDSAHAAMALFMRGKRLHGLGQKQKGLQIALNAVATMKHTDYDHKNHELAHLYAILAKMYCTDGRYDEALSMSKEQERYVELSKESHSQEWYRRNLMRTYTIRLEIVAKMGRLVEADSIYVKYGITPEADPLCGDAVLSYYRLRGMNDQSMQFLNAAIKNLREDGDTLGRNMQRLLDDMGDEFFSVGDYRRAAECYAGTSRIADSLAARSLSNLTAEVYKVIDNERAIAKHDERLTIIIAGLVLFFVIFILMLREALIVRRKNQKMMVAIHQLMHYRNMAIQNGNNDEMGENETENVVNEELRRFKEADKRIMKERLFANPDFGRDDLMRLLGVDKNTLPTLLHNYTGTNVSGYINVKRMEYAVSLIKEHPEYTLGAIAEACGIKSPATFIRNFKATYDMTPSEYRQQLEKAAAPPPPFINI